MRGKGDQQAEPWVTNYHAYGNFIQKRGKCIHDPKPHLINE